MLNNLSIEKAQLLKQKIQDIKNTLDLDLFTYSSDNVSIIISVFGNIKEIINNQNKTLEQLIPIINEATTKAKQDYETKQAQLLKDEMMKLM